MALVSGGCKAHGHMAVLRTIRKGFLLLLLLLLLLLDFFAFDVREGRVAFKGIL